MSSEYHHLTRTDVQWCVVVCSIPNRSDYRMQGKDGGCEPFAEMEKPAWM